MLRIAVETENHGDVFLDVQDLSLSLTFEFGDIANIGKNKAPHSLSFTLPFTEKNDLAFGGFRDLSSIDVDIRESIDCRVYEDTNEVLSGVIQVMSMDLQARKYKCVVYGKSADVYDKLRDARWVDIFTNPDGTIDQGLDHDKTANNIRQNQEGYDITQGGYGNKVLFYPLQNTGLSRLTSSGEMEYRAMTHQALTNENWQSEYYGKWTAKSHNVGIQVEWLLEKVFAYCGLRLVKNYVFDDDATLERPNPYFGDMYYMTNTPNQKYRPYYGSDVSGAFWTTLSPFAINQVIEMNGDNLSTNGALLTFDPTPEFDPDDLMTQAGFVAPTAGQYNFAFNLEWTRPFGALTDSFQLGIVPYSNTNNQELINYNLWSPQTAAGSGASGEAEWVFSVNLAANEEMSIRLFWASITTNSAQSIDVDAEDCRLRFLSYQGSSNTVVVPQSMGDESVGEWLEELMRRYNLTLNADNNTKTATFEMRSELYRTNTTYAKDWSDKVDRSKPVTLGSNTEDLKRKIIFKSGLGENAFDEYWDETYARPWDQFVWNSSKQYTKGEEEIGEYFMQAKWVKVPDSIGDDGPIFDSYVDQFNKPNMLQMYRGLEYNNYWQVSPAGDNRFFVYRNNAMQGFGGDFLLYMYDNVDSEEYGMVFSNYRAALPSFYGNMLGWKQRTQYQSLYDVAGAKGFWKSYYETEIREKYSIDTRVLDCEMYLTGSDLATSTWGDIIRIDLQYYYLEAVRDYYVGGKKASKVRLRRLLSSDSSGAVVGANCNLNILTYEIDCFGVVTPFDRYGNELVFNEACCAQLGGGEWFYDENTSICSTGETCDAPPSTSIGEQARYVNSRGGDFLFDPIQKTFDVKGGQEIRWTMVCTTPKTGNAFAINSVGETLLPLPANCNVGFNVDYLATNTSSANRGDVEFGTFTGVVRGQDFVGDKAGSDDQTSRIGDVTPLTIGIETHAADGALYARVFCGGMEGEWTLDMRATARIIERDFDFGSTLHAQDDSPMQFQDGTYTLMNL